MRAIGGGLEAAITLYAEGDTLELLRRYEGVLANLSIVSQSRVAEPAAAHAGLEVEDGGARAAVAGCPAAGDTSGRWGLARPAGLAG